MNEISIARVENGWVIMYGNYNSQAYPEKYVAENLGTLRIIVDGLAMRQATKEGSKK